MQSAERTLTCVIQATKMNRGAVVACVAKASSLAKALIKLLTVIPTMPHPKPIQRVCTKESEGIQVYFICPITRTSPLSCVNDCT